MGISTRPAVASDEEFVSALMRETIRPYVEATWPSDEEREEYSWSNRFQGNETEIIQVDGEDAGHITITRRPGWIVLEEIHITPRFQGRCIGQMFIRKVLAEADERRIPTELKVLKKNPAQKLYMRLGFVTVRDAGERLYMVRDVQQVEVADASTAATRNVVLDLFF